MSVQTTQVEIARAKLITGLIVLAVMAGSCAPQMAQKLTQTPAPTTPAQVATTQTAAR